MFSLFFKNELQSTKWGRVRINYDHLEQVLKAKEYQNEPSNKKPLSIQSTVR